MSRRSNGCPRYTVGAGRMILRNGQDFISVDREGKTRPVVADKMAHLLVGYLNSNCVRGRSKGRTLGRKRGRRSR